MTTEQLEVNTMIEGMRSLQILEAAQREAMQQLAEEWAAAATEGVGFKTHTQTHIHTHTHHARQSSNVPRKRLLRRCEFIYIASVYSSYKLN